MPRILLLQIQLSIGSGFSGYGSPDDELVSSTISPSTSVNRSTPAAPRYSDNGLETAESQDYNMGLLETPWPSHRHHRRIVLRNGSSNLSSCFALVTRSLPAKLRLTTANRYDSKFSHRGFDLAMLKTIQYRFRQMIRHRFNIQL